MEQEQEQEQVGLRMFRWLTAGGGVFDCRRETTGYFILRGRHSVIISVIPLMQMG